MVRDTRENRGSVRGGDRNIRDGDRSIRDGDRCIRDGGRCGSCFDRNV